jgi:hypothetical protein
MNEDKADSVESMCPTCDEPMEYTDGNTRCLCHECGTMWSYRLLNEGTKYPTKDNPVQEMSIYYDSTTKVFPHDDLGKRLDGNNS